MDVVVPARVAADMAVLAIAGENAMEHVLALVGLAAQAVVQGGMFSLFTNER